MIAAYRIHAVEDTSGASGAQVACDQGDRLRSEEPREVQNDPSPHPPDEGRVRDPQVRPEDGAPSKTPSFRVPWRILVPGVAIIGLGGLATSALASYGERRENSAFTAFVTVATAAIPSEEVVQLLGSEVDLGTAPDRTLVDQLRKIRASREDIAFAYLNAARGPDVVFLADAESPDSEDYSPPGQVFDEAPPALRETLSTGRVTLAHATDRWGSWVSAFAPIVAPSQVPWGHKAFGGYLGDNRETWKKYDATELVAGATERIPMLIDQGRADSFLGEQLKTHLLGDAAKAADYPVTIRMQDGYDHSYHFVSSFIGDHIEHHARAVA